MRDLPPEVAYRLLRDMTDLEDSEILEWIATGHIKRLDES